MKIDVHVHVVGNGSRGSGCWYRPRGLTRLGQPLMLRAFGLPSDSIDGDLEGLYAAKLLEYVRGSSLDAIVILAQDDAYLPDGRRIGNFGSFFVPNDYVLGLARAHPEFLPAVSIHPARSDALDELDRCLAAGAVALKCLPNCQNIDWNDRRYTKFLERMAGAGLPILAHTGGEHTLPVYDRKLENPHVLDRALEIGVKCIAAHCGTPSGLFDRNWVPALAEMMRRFPNLYGDNSAFNVANNRIRGDTVPRCLREPMAGRILHGSDVPVPVSTLWAQLKGLVSADEARAARAERNPIQRDYLIKRAMGFGDDSFTLAASEVLRLPQVPTD